MKGVFENNDLHIIAKQVHGFRPFPLMFHAHLEVVYVLNGRIQMQIDGQNHALQAGQLSVCFPYVLHSYEEAPEADAIILLFSADTAGVFSRRVLQAKPACPFLEDAEALHTLLEQIVCHRAADGVIDELVTGAYVSALVGELLLRMPQVAVDEMDTAIIRRLLIYCAEHFREAISISTAAEAVHISPSYVTRLFSTKLDCSFRTYVNRLRIGEVKQLLQDTDRTILDIMLECGFYNQSTFNRIFMEETGLTPRDYRQGLQNQQNAITVAKQEQIC